MMTFLHLTLQGSYLFLFINQHGNEGKWREGWEVI